MIGQTGFDPPSGHPILGVINYGADADLVAGRAASPVASITMETIGGSGGSAVWFTDQPVTYGIAGEIHYALSDNLLFGVAHYPADDMAKAAYLAYRDMVQLTRRLGITQLIRTWNYFPDINGYQADLERYRGFCLGRYEALADAGFSMTGDLPSASAVGSRQGDFWIIFLAGNGTTLQVENPLQTSAFRYPANYGPRSPSFSRAVRFSSCEVDQLFVSGTASIRGHETVYPGDPNSQCATTLTNLRALLARAGVNEPRHLGPRAAWKVYIRHVSDFLAVEACMAQALDPASPILYVIGDICRESLLVEIEGVVNMRQSFR